MALLKVSGKARQALTMGPGERRAFAEKHGVMDEVKKVWKGGNICGQCRHFSQNGQKHSGMNGSCRALQTIDWVEPWRERCQGFESCKTKTTD